MLRGDSGEFQWAMASLNVAHATGYPLFTLLGYAWQLLSLSDNIAWQLNLLAPFFAALAVLTIFIFIRSLTARSDAAWVGALFFALAPVMWFNASILEVYSLHAFLLALILYLLWQWTQNPKQNTLLYLAFFVLGLALAHHRLIVLALPAILVWLLLTDYRLFFRPFTILGCALLLVPGLLLYGYVPLRLLPEGFTLDFAFYDIILGREYATSLLREFNPLRVLGEIPFQNFHIGLVLALVGAVTLFQRARNLNIALWLVYVLDVAFALVYSVPDVEVFLTSSFVVTAIWIGAGAAFILEWIVARVGNAGARVGNAGARVGNAGARVGNAGASVPYALVMILISLFGVVHYAEIQTAVAAEAAPESRARAIAAANLPEGAYLELDWETATALRFLQTTQALRPDLEARLLELNQRQEFWRALYNANAGRAVFVERGVSWKRAPAGFGVEPRANDLAQIVRAPIEMQRVRAAVNDRVDLLGYQTTANAFIVYWRVNKALAKDVATFVHYLDANDEKIAQDDHAPCCQAVYGYRTSEWEAGQIYADVFKPAPENTKSFRVGMYENIDGDIEPYGEEINIKPAEQ